jgi:hypothetical protein
LILFHAGQCVKLQLASLGLDSEFLTCDIQAPDNDVWQDIRRKYWHGRETYYLPVCTWNPQYLQTGQHPEAAAVLAMAEARSKRKNETDATARADSAMDSTEQKDVTKRQYPYTGR